MNTYRILLNPEPDGGFTASVPVLPGCISYGENLPEAMEMIKEAILLYLEELMERGVEIPNDNNTLEYSLNLAV